MYLFLLLCYYCYIPVLLFSDADGDMITFSSDEELQEALKSVSDGVFKLFVVGKNFKFNRLFLLLFCHTLYHALYQASWGIDCSQTQV